MKKDSRTSEQHESRKTYYALVTAIIISSIILIYLVGILLCPPFAKYTMKLPVISHVTYFLAGNIYADLPEPEPLIVKEEKTIEATTESKKEEVDVEEDQTILQRSENPSYFYLDHCMFLGDSRTVAMATYGFVKESQTLAQVGLSHVDARRVTYSYRSGAQYSFASYLYGNDADVVYISYGINGVAYVDEDTYKTQYESIVDEVIEAKPNSKIVIQSIWPVQEGRAETAGITNDLVDYYNEYLLDLAKSKGIYYLDSASVLKDENNAMNSAYNIGDGLHYNESGYNVAMQYIKSHPVPGVK